MTRQWVNEEATCAAPEASMSLAPRHHSPHLSLTFPLVGLYGHQHAQTSLRSCIRPDFHLASVVHTSPCDDTRRNGPRSVTLKEYKYDLGMFSVVSAPSLIYHSRTLSHSFAAFHEYSREKQVRTPWNPRYDSIAAFISWSLSYFKLAPYIRQEAN